MSIYISQLTPVEALMDSAALEEKNQLRYTIDVINPNKEIIFNVSHQNDIKSMTYGVMHIEIRQLAR